MAASNVKGDSLRRRIVLQSKTGCSIAAVEDDFHYFIVVLEHDDREVIAAYSAALRTPWSNCSQAGGLLQQFVGLPLSTHPLRHAAAINPKLQCTHQYDLALMAIAQASRGCRRQYDAKVPDHVSGCAQASLERDGEACLYWTLDRTTILTPERYAGLDLRAFSSWALDDHDDDALEALLVLRRAVMISKGRGMDLDSVETALEDLPQMAGACFVYQPENTAAAHRNKGSTIEHTQRAHELLYDLDSQIAALARSR